MGLDKDLKYWLNHHKMLIKHSSSKAKTHNTMEFAEFLSINKDKKDDFFRKLAKTLDNGVINFLIEIRTDYFKFMVDVDFKNEFGLTLKQKNLLLKVINQSVNEFVGNQIKNNYTIISSCKDEKVQIKIRNSDETEEMIKVGFHLIWPNLIVGMEEARYLRSAIIQKLSQTKMDFLALMIFYYFII